MCFPLFMASGKTLSSPTARQATSRQRTNRVRIALEESCKERIREYARSHPNASNSVILAWVCKNIRPGFHQSTLSTLLIKAGIINDKRDGRGRPHAGAAASSESPDSLSVSSPSSEPTACVAYEDLIKPAPNRKRARVGNFHNVDIKILEECYGVIRQGTVRLTWDGILARALTLLLQQNPLYKKKKLTGYLDQVRNRYLLTSIIFDCLKDNLFSYEEMVCKLGAHFPALQYASQTGEHAATQVSSNEDTHAVHHIAVHQTASETPYTQLPIGASEEVFDPVSSGCVWPEPQMDPDTFVDHQPHPDQFGCLPNSALSDLDFILTPSAPTMNFDAFAPATQQQQQQPYQDLVDPLDFASSLMTVPEPTAALQTQVDVPVAIHNLDEEAVHLAVYSGSSTATTTASTPLAFEPTTGIDAVSGIATGQYPPPLVLDEFDPEPAARPRSLPDPVAWFDDCNTAIKVEPQFLGSAFYNPVYQEQVNLHDWL